MIKLFTKSVLVTVLGTFLVMTSFAAGSKNSNGNSSTTGQIELADANADYSDPTFISYVEAITKNVIVSQLSNSQKVAFWNKYQAYINSTKAKATHSGQKGILLSEDFEAGIPANWITIDNDGGIPNPSALQVTSWDTIGDPFGTNGFVAASNSWVTPIVPADDYLITSQVMLDGGSTLNWQAAAVDPAFPDGYEVRISTTGTTVANFLANPALFSVAAENPSWTSHSVDLAAAGYTNQIVYIAFRNNSTDQYILIVDNVEIIDALGVADAAIFGSATRPSGIAGGYKNIPLEQSQSNNVDFEVAVLNVGSDSITGVTVNGTVNPGGSTVTGSLAGIGAGFGDFVSTNTFNATPATSYTADFSVTINENDIDSTNDVASFAFTTAIVGDSLYARENATTPGVSLGFTGGSGRFGNTYVINAQDTLTSITIFFGTDPVGKTFEVFVGELNGTGDTYASGPITGISGAGFHTFYTGGVILPVGTYVIGANQFQTTNLGVGLTTTAFYPNTAYYGGYGAWNAIESIGNPAFNGSFMVRPAFSSNVVANTLTPFTLQNPPNGTNLTLAGNPGTQVVIDWTASVSSAGLPVNYTWEADAQGGSFTPALVGIPSDNNGGNNVLTLTYGDIDNLLANLGVPAGGTSNISWRVVANSGVAQEISNVFDINLTRGILSSTARDFEAYTAGDWIGASDNEWSTWSGTTGPGADDAQVSIAQSQSGVNSLILENANTDALFLMGNQTTGTWGNGFSMYVSTGNSAYYNLQEDETPAVRWVFEVFMDDGGAGNVTIGGGTPNPITANFTYPQNTWFDVRHYCDLDNDSLQIWIDGNLVIATPYTASGGTTMMGAFDFYPAGGSGPGTTYYIDDMYLAPDSLRSPVSLTSFDLSSPSDGTAIDVSSTSSAQVAITWTASTASSGSVTYRWLADGVGGDFSNPILAYDSDNSGADTQLTLTSSAIDAALDNIGLGIGQVANLIWTVEATGGTTSLLADNGPFTIDITRIAGLSDDVFNSKVNFYPNPTSGELVVEVKDNLVKSVVISNMVGQTQRVFENIESRNVLDLSNLSSGLYFVKFVTEKGEITKKLMVD